MNRAHAIVSFKSVDAEQRIIEGIASTPELDRQGDSMDPAGAVYRLPLPLLWQHRADQPIGKVISAAVTSAGIKVRAQIAKGVLPFIDDAWSLIKAGLVGGLSIGWKPLAEPMVKNGMLVWPKWEWMELSAVTIPANAQANISLVKSLDRVSLAASGLPSAASTAAGVSASRRIMSMNVSERLTSEKTSLQAKTERLEALLTKDQNEGGLEADETTERENLLKDVRSLTTSVSHLQTLEAAQMAGATGIQVPAAAMTVRPSMTKPSIQVVDRPKGQIFVRYAMAVAAGKGSMSDTLAYAKRFTDTPEVVAYIKATEGVATLNSPSWGSELVNPSTVSTEFVDLLRPMTIIGRVPGFRTVPFNIPIITQTGGSTFEWVGEGGVKPVGELAFDRVTMTWSKVAGIVVLTEELVRFSSPSAEETVRRDLTEQCARFLDEQFIQVAVSAGPNNPASITNGVSSPSASGTDLDALLSDLATALATFDAAGISTDGLVIVTTPAIARGISMLTNPLGQTPNGFAVTPNGGTLLGYPIVVSASVDAGTLVIFKPSEIFLADDGQVRLDSSNQATLDMSGGSPTTPSFNLWQRNCVGIRAERFIRWQKRRDDVVAVIDNAAYGPSVGSP